MPSLGASHGDLIIRSPGVQVVQLDGTPEACSDSPLGSIIHKVIVTRDACPEDDVCMPFFSPSAPVVPGDAALELADQDSLQKTDAVFRTSEKREVVGTGRV